MNVAAAVAGRKEACGRGADGVAGCRETGKGPCFLPATPQDQFIACSRDDSIHVPVHVPQPSGVRGLAAAHALPGPPITSLMHASACARTRMHAAAHVPEHTTPPMHSRARPSWAMKSPMCHSPAGCAVSPQRTRCRARQSHRSCTPAHVTARACMHPRVPPSPCAASRGR